MSKDMNILQEKQIAGINESEYNESGSSYSKDQIFLWLAAGVIYSIYAGSLISITTILLFLPGIFIISLASIPFFLLRIKKVKAIERLNKKEFEEKITTGKSNAYSQIPTLIFYTFTSFVGFIFPIITAIFFVYTINGLFR